MFWGINLKSNCKYIHKTAKAFHISNVALDITTVPNNANSNNQIYISIEKKRYLLCTLRKGTCEQTSIDLNFNEGDEVSFHNIGNGEVTLSGYLLDDSNSSMFSDESELSDAVQSKNDADSDEEEVDQEKIDLRATLNAKKNKKKQQQLKQMATTKVNKKSQSKNQDVIEEDDLDEEEDDEDDNEIGVKMTEDVLYDNDDDDDDSEEDDEDMQDDDEEEEEQEEESEEENVYEPKRKQPKLKGQNQLANGDAAKKAVPTAAPTKASKKAKKEKAAENNSNLNQKERVITGGVKVTDLRVGNGLEVKAGKRLMVYYEGRLVNNNKIFDSMKTGNGFKFQVGRGEVIKGWDVGLIGMKCGGKRRIVCPPGMAYGARGSLPAVPPNSTLVFDVELKNVM